MCVSCVCCGDEGSECSVPVLLFWLVMLAVLVVLPVAVIVLCTEGVDECRVRSGGRTILNVEGHGITMVNLDPQPRRELT